MIEDRAAGTGAAASMLEKQRDGLRGQCEQLRANNTGLVNEVADLKRKLRAAEGAREHLQAQVPPVSRTPLHRCTTIPLYHCTLLQYCRHATRASTSRRSYRPPLPIPPAPLHQCTLPQYCRHSAGQGLGAGRGGLAGARSKHAAGGGAGGHPSQAGVGGEESGGGGAPHRGDGGKGAESEENTLTLYYRRH
eukprot:3405095-Pyramimonas_sp.AAC.1